VNDHDTCASSRLAALGWDAHFARALEDVRAIDPSHELTPARVVAQHRTVWSVATEDGDLGATLAGRLRAAAPADSGLNPVAGDWVACACHGDTASIRHVLQRRSTFTRRRPGRRHKGQVLAANIDITLIAVSLAAPVNVRRLERFVALGWESGAIPLVVLTKQDVGGDATAAEAQVMHACPGVDVVALSAVTGAGLDRLRGHLFAGRTAVVLGESGAGKSTLTNALIGEERLRTLDLRRDGKGRHTTTHRELFVLPGDGLIIDTPGLREVGLWEAAEGVDVVFDDVAELARGCRFADCAHATEPGCAVQAAVADGVLDAERLGAWHRLQLELEHLRRRGNPRATTAAKERIRAAQRAYRKHQRGKER
jgi:ribosome biogenesis GTPase / thiamine phosphate phosphatase